MPVSLPQSLNSDVVRHCATGKTARIGTGRGPCGALVCTSDTEIPPSFVGSGSALAKMGETMALPIPWTYIVVRAPGAIIIGTGALYRSEERRVGKECRSRW